LLLRDRFLEVVLPASLRMEALLFLGWTICTPAAIGLDSCKLSV
jgi:hypothetical protein